MIWLQFFLYFTIFCLSFSVHGDLNTFEGSNLKTDIHSLNRFRYDYNYDKIEKAFHKKYYFFLTSNLVIL